MTVKELIEIIDSDEFTGDSIYTDDEFSINSIYYRNGEVILQSNEIDSECELDVSFISHCLNYFDYDDEICFMICDEDNDFWFYDITSHYIDGEGDIRLNLSSRD